MTTPSYNKLATSTAIIMRSPPMGADGKMGPMTQAGTLLITPPDTMDASAILGFGIQNPHSAWVVYYEGSFDFHKGDKFIIDGITYQMRNIRKFPNYRKTGNSSYEIVIELPEP